MRHDKLQRFYIYDLTQRHNMRIDSLENRRNQWGANYILCSSGNPMR